MMTQPQTNMHDIRRTLALIYAPHRLYEVRILTTGYTGTVSGYFDSENFDTTADTIAPWSGKAPVYATLNPCASSLLARSANRLTERAKYTTSDADIMQHRWLPIDFDPVRPAGISSTDAEHDAALQRAQACRDWLCGNWGWPAPVYADSGNGAHVLSRIDLPNDKASRALIKRCLEAVALYFNDDMVTVDLTTSNAARIWKVYGTLACKGDNLPERPHRLARLLDVPDPLIVVTREQLEALAALVPEPPKATSRSSYDKREAFNLETWIAAHGVPVVSHRPWNNSGYRWVINPCPWNNAHTNGSAFIVQLANGAIAAGCHHNGCAENDWHALRDLYEPGWRAYRDNPPQLRMSSTHTGRHPQPDEQAPDTPEDDHALNTFFASAPWPEIAPQAFHGLAGEIVRTIEPYTEADPVAILLQFLTMVGNLVGRTPYFPAEADWHYLNLFVCLVGETSKGRKGVSAGYPKRLLETVDDVWAKNRIMSGLSSGEGLIWYVRDPSYKQGKDGAEECTDEGEQDKRLLVLEPEFARVLRVLARDGNTLSAVMRHAWDDGTLQTMVSGRRVAPVRATGAHVSIIGHITVDELRRNLTETETSNGFANRFLWCCVRRSKLLPEGGMYPQEALTPLAHQLKTAVIAARKTGRMQRDDLARARWAAIYEELSEGKPGLVGHVTARAEAQVLRLSCLYALLDQSPIVQVSHLHAALALWKYAEASAAYSFGDALGDALPDEILHMLRAVAPEGMTRTDIYNAFGRNKKSTTIQQALAGLWRHQLVTYTKEATEGRPIERWYARLSSSVSTQKTQLTQKGETPPHDTQGQLPLNAFNTFNAYTQGENGTQEVSATPCAHGRTQEQEEQSVCLDCGTALPAPAFTDLTASVIWCDDCQQAQLARPQDEIYYCAVCGAEVGTKTTTAPTASMNASSDTGACSADDDEVIEWTG
jgi:hypothetical protein